MKWSLELPEVLVCPIRALDFTNSRAECHFLAEIGFFLVGFTVVGSVYPSEVCKLRDWRLLPRQLPLNGEENTFWAA